MSHVGTAVAAGGAVLAANELMKTGEDADQDKKTSHLIKAAACAAIAVGAYEILNRQRREGASTNESREIVGTNEMALSHWGPLYEETDQGCRPRRHQHHQRRSLSRSRSRSHSRSRSRSRHGRESGHTRRLVEELAGAYSLGRELLGDKEHHVAHLIAEAIGGTALFKEAGRHLS
jgi:hypothetical protein